MSRVDRDPERGQAVAARLKELGAKGTLIKAAEQGYVTQLACMMPECFCPEELGGACYFEPVTNDWSDWRSVCKTPVGRCGWAAKSASPGAQTAAGGLLRTLPT